MYRPPNCQMIATYILTIARNYVGAEQGFKARPNVSRTMRRKRGCGCIHRPIDGLACRGQRTRTNAHTRKDGGTPGVI
ncbi:hypothetical protein NL676_019664 [Syzygium grande]|nr:hypothetical protein NL676_019664 [Syzygium grande]